MSRITEDLERGKALAWSSLRPAFDHAIACARECEYTAAQASNLAQTHVPPAYPPLVELLAQAGKQIEVAEPRARAAAEPAIRAVLAAELPGVVLPRDIRSECGVRDDMEGAAKLWLLKPEHLDLIPDGTSLVSIMWEVVIKGVDEIDPDTRGGCLAFGLFDAQIYEPVNGGSDA